jgi:hypothetical protein
MANQTDMLQPLAQASNSIGLGFQQAGNSIGQGFQQSGTIGQGFKQSGDDINQGFVQAVATLSDSKSTYLDRLLANLLPLGIGTVIGIIITILLLVIFKKSHFNLINYL